MKKTLLKAIISGIGSCIGYRLATSVCEKVSDPVMQAKFKRKFNKIKTVIITKEES